MIRHVRPYQIFELLQAPAPDRVASIKLPNRRDLKLLETAILLTAVRLTGAKRIFEFGTFLGATTLNLALNTPADAEIFTLDLGADGSGARQLEPDAELTRQRAGRRLDFEGTPEARKIVTLTGDSTRFDFSPWRESIDLVFVDGGHDYDTVCSDTRNAFEMLRRNGPSCVLWHDFGHPEYPDVERCLAELPGEILHVEETALCLRFSGRP